MITLYALYTQIIYDEYDSNSPELRVFSTAEKRDRFLVEMKAKNGCGTIEYSKFSIEYKDIDSCENVRSDF